MANLRKFLMITATLAIFAGGAAYAQETANPEIATPESINAEAVNKDLPFINNGANKPVLQAISPDGVAIAPNELTVPDATEHGAEGHKGKKGLPQFDPSTYPKQIFWLTLTFVVLYLTFSKSTLPAIGGAIARREAKIANDLRNAEALKITIEKTKTEYGAAIAAAQAEAQKLIADVQADIKRLAETQDAAFKANAENAINGLESKIKISRTRIESELSDIAATLAVEIAAQIANVKADKAAAQNIVGDLSGQAKAA